MDSKYSNHIVLIHPVIPQNTGNIMRTCVATDTKLHIVKPIGFLLDDKHMRRAGLDYIKDLKMQVHESWEEFVESELLNQEGSCGYEGTCGRESQKYLHFFTRYSKMTYSEDSYKKGGSHYLFFGHEHDGIPKEILKEYLDYCVRIPMFGDSRSLNLSNCVAIGLYECLRQQDFPNLERHEVQKGEDYLYEN